MTRMSQSLTSSIALASTMSGRSQNPSVCCKSSASPCAFVILRPARTRWVHSPFNTVAKAIDELNLKEHIIFIGHELNINSKYLLENDKMDYVIGHDVELEVTVAFDKIDSYFNNTLAKDFYYSDVLIYNKYNCLNKRVF